MEYQKIANLIDHDASSEPNKFRTKNWVQTNMNQEVHIMKIQR